jgi:hypothetical protein
MAYFNRSALTKNGKEEKMILLQEYFNDGAHHQAKAVLAYLQAHDGIEESWSDEWKRYKAEVHIGRWENCREQGYVLYLNSDDYKRQLNIAFFEHRNSDKICAVVWEQGTINSPNINSAKFEGIYKTKYDVSHSEPYGNALQMADWIWEQLEEFWKETSAK